MNLRRHRAVALLVAVGLSARAVGNLLHRRRREKADVPISPARTRGVKRSSEGGDD